MAVHTISCDVYVGTHARGTSREHNAPRDRPGEWSKTESLVARVDAMESVPGAARARSADVQQNARPCRSYRARNARTSQKSLSPCVCAHTRNDFGTHTANDRTHSRTQTRSRSKALCTLQYTQKVIARARALKTCMCVCVVLDRPSTQQ